MRTLPFLVLGLTLAGMPARAVPRMIDLTPYANANIAATLFPTFPTGRVVPPKNRFGVPFNIPREGNNYVVINGADPLTVSIGITGVHKVYTLLQAFGPSPASRICTVEFLGSAGARQEFTLYGGGEIRDFFESNYARTINGTTTRPAFEEIGRGGAYTNDTTTGPRGFYNFDEQEFTLAPDFATQTLNAVRFTGGDHGTPILLGLTVQTSQAPPPGVFSVLAMRAFWMIVGGIVLAIVVVAGATRLRRWLTVP